MTIHHGTAVWEGGLSDGRGRMLTPDRGVATPFSAPSRFENREGSSPESLIAAAHAGCFSMALASILSRAGHEPEKLETTAEVHLDEVEAGFSISSITLRTIGTVPGIDEDEFARYARLARDNCPVSQMVTGTAIRLEHRLEHRDDGETDG